MQIPSWREEGEGIW